MSRPSTTQPSGGSRPTVLVTGATGNVGSALTELLTADDVSVRALSRNGADVPAGVDNLTGDLTDASTCEHALIGASHMFVFPAQNFDPDVLVAAAEAGVERVVVMSSASVAHSDVTVNPIARRHFQLEESVRATFTRWTVLRPDTFMANALAWAASIKARDPVRIPFPASKRNPIHEADLAAVARCALLEDGHDRAVYELTGPAPITQRQQIELIGDAIGREIAVEEIPRDRAEAEMSERMPAAVAVRLLDYMERSVAEEPRRTSGVEQVTGRRAREFRQWALDHCEDFH